MRKHLDKSYLQLINALKSQIHTSQIKVHLAVNYEMIILYFKIGNLILEKQKEKGWGSKVINNIAIDLKKEFPQMNGFSSRNLVYMK